jgi:hypothetical protein
MKSMKFWTSSGFEVGNHSWRLDERRNKTFNTSGSDISETNTYTYNEMGFRGDSLYKDGFRIMSVGCSHTEGVGVSDNQTWPHYFSRQIDNGVELVNRRGIAPLTFSNSKHALAWAILDFHNKILECDRLHKLDCLLSSSQIDAQIHERLKRKGGRAYLIAENPEFSPIVIELARTPLVIEGIAIGVVRDLNAV